MTDLASDYAERIRALRGLVERLGPDHRDPHRFMEDKDSAVKTLGELADEIQLDQVFAKLPSHPTAQRGTIAPVARTVVDRKGRPIAVEVRRARRAAG